MSVSSHNSPRCQPMDGPVRSRVVLSCVTQRSRLGAPAHPRWRSAARSLDRFSIAKVAAKCDPLLVRTAADLGENCGYVHSQALLGAAEEEQASEIPGSPVAALFRGRLGGRITLVECSRRGQPSFTRRALAVTGGSALAEEPGVTLGLLVSVRPADRETAGRESDLGCRSKRGTASPLRSGGRAASLLFDSQGEGEVGCRLTPPTRDRTSRPGPGVPELFTLGSPRQLSWRASGSLIRDLRQARRDERREHRRGDEQDRRQAHEPPRHLALPRLAGDDRAQVLVGRRDRLR